jgi:hypothetical protein
MQLDYLKLIGYKPLALAGTTEVEYTPRSPYQLILGTNGCGKSSFLSQLSMLPAVPGDYHEGGLKHWEGSHNGKRYILMSNIGKKTARHSFKIVDEDGKVDELNPGGTGAVQKELVFQHSKLTQELQDVRLGRQSSHRFVDMSPARRRDWMQMLAPVNVDSATEMYQHYMTLSREAMTIHKHAIRELTDVTNTVLPAEERATLEEHISQTKTELTRYMEATIPLPTQLRGEFHLNRIEELSLQLLNQPVGLIPNEYRTYGDIQQATSRIASQILGYQEHYDRYLNDFYELDRKVKELGGITDEELTAHSKQIEMLDQHRKTLRLSGEPLVADHEALLVQQILADRVDEIQELLTRLPVTQPHYSRENYVQIQERLKRTEAERESLQNRRSHLQMELRRIDTADSVVCPSCNTSFKPGIELSVRDQIVNELNIIHGKLELLKQTYDDDTATVEDIDHWRQTRQRISQLLTGDALAKHRASIVDSVYFTTGPMSLVGQVRYWLPTLNDQVEKARVEVEYQNAVNAYQLAVSANNQARQQNVQLLNEQYSKLEQTLSEALTRLETAKTKQRELQSIERAFLTREASRQELERLLDQSMASQVLVAKMDFNQRMANLIGEGQSRLAYLENKLRTADQAQNNADRLKATLEAKVLEAKAATELASILSPKDGMIAEQLSSSINAIVDQMNDIIRRVWTYDLEIMPCGLESGELDYKFPLCIRGDIDNPVSDVCIGSDSQRVMVNFAFRLVVDAYLGLVDYPLYLDELGREFDEVHAPRVMQYVKYLVESQTANQVFLISHNPALHTMFTLADVNILHVDNVSVGQNHNQYITVS